MDSNDFELKSEASRKARHIKASHFDEYASNIVLVAYTKSIPKADRTSCTIIGYPSSLDAVLNDLRTKFKCNSFVINDMIFHYGLLRLWEYISGGEIAEIVNVMEDVRKYIEVPRTKNKYIYQVNGDNPRKVFKISDDTRGFGEKIALLLNVTMSSVWLLALLIGLHHSPTVSKNHYFLLDSYLYKIDDKIYNSSKQFLEENLTVLQSYSKSIYTLYTTEMVELSPDFVKLDKMYKILSLSKNKGMFDGNLPNYKDVINSVNKSITGRHNDVYDPNNMPDIENGFDEMINCGNNIKELDVLSKKLGSVKLPDNPTNTVIDSNMHNIEKPIVIEKPVETDIKKVVKHLIKLIFNRLHLSKK